MPFPSTWSLRRHLLFLVLLAVLPALLIVLAAGLARHRVSLQASEHAATTVAQLVAKQQEDLAANLQQSLSILAEASEFRTQDTPANNRLLRNILKQNPGLLVLLAVDIRGRVIASSGPMDLGLLNDRKYFRDALRTRQFAAGEYVISRSTGRPVFHFAYPVLDPAGKVRLFLVTSLRIKSHDSAPEVRALPPGSSLSILDHGGTVLYSSTSTGLLPGMAFPQERLVPEFEAGSGRVLRARDDRGTALLAATSRVYLPGGSAPYFITQVEIPEAAALAGARRELVRNLALLLLAAASAMAVAWILGGRLLIRPIQALVEHVDRVGQGDFALANHPGRTVPELNRLGRAFEEMTRSLQRHHEALRASEEHYRLIFNAVNEAIFIHDLESGAILDVNAKVLELYDCTREEALACSVEMLSEGLSPYSQAEAMAWIRKATAWEPQVFEWRARRLTGGLFWAEVNMRRARIDGEERLLVSVRDTDARHTAEVASQERETLFRRLFERSGDANLLIDGHLFVDCNQVAVEILGAQDRASVLNTHPSALSPEFQPDGQSSRDKAEEMIATAFKLGSYRFDWTHRKLDGTEFPVEVTLTVVPWQGKQILHTTWRDRTDQHRAEAQRRILETQFLQAQKLESLGVLAGGIAHDFNNLLTAVLGNLNLAEFNLSPEAPAMPFLHNAERTVLKASDLTKQMLAYSGKGRFFVKLHDMNEVVQEMTHLLKVSISKKAIFRLSLTEQLPTFEADGAQFQQVIMNLVTNASDALEDHEGVIHLSTGVEVLDAQLIASTFPSGPLEPGRYVTLEVSDTGAGISPEVLSRIFDPFFTTKLTGRGLGLSAMLGILRGHKAGLKIYSEVGRGSTFKVYFPAATGAALPTLAVGLSDQTRFEGVVLLVDDEKTILQATGSALQQLGFTVLLAGDGLEAMDTFRKEQARIDLVVMDLTMPRMDGREAFNTMRQLRPDLKVILSSGYNEQESIQPFVGKGLAGFIQKPYTLDSLRCTISRILLSGD